MKKIALVLVVGAILCGGAIAFSTFNTPEQAATIEVINGQANYPVYANVKELEDDSDVIVLATFTGERENFEIKKDTEMGSILVDLLSLSTIDVKKVFKGDQGKGKATVFEQGAILDGKYLNTEGYKLMDEKGEYLLFLRKNKDIDTYSMVGMHQGKFDINLTKKATKIEHSAEGYKKAFATRDYEFLGQEHEQEKFYQLKDEAVKKYKGK